MVEEQAKLLEEDAGLKVTDNELTEYLEDVMKELKQFRSTHSS